jgi:hypothetical protein
LVAIRCFCLLPKKETKKVRKKGRKKESDDSTSAIAAAAAAAGIALDWIGLDWNWFLCFVFCCNTYNIISC